MQGLDMYTLSYIITSQNVWKKIRIWKKNSPMENKFEHGTTFDLKKIDFENKFQFFLVLSDLLDSELADFADTNSRRRFPRPRLLR